MSTQPLLIKSTERKVLRKPLQIPVVVTSRTFDQTVSKEITRTLDVSPLGVCFVIRRTFEPGQMLHLSLNLPAEMRKHDQNAAEYEVWAIVRYCHRIAINSNMANQIGVAFIGRNQPRSYDQNPFSIYELSVCPEDGFWHYFETGRTINRRRDRRFQIPIEFDLTAPDLTGSIITTERTVSESISVGGACVFSVTPPPKGSIVNLTSRQYNVTLSAEVRAVRAGKDGIARVHLKFLDGVFPLEGVDAI